MSQQPESEAFVAVLTITVKAVDGGGLLASLTSDGAMSDPWIDRRFYSMPEMPPPELAPYVFWGTLLGHIGGFLSEPG